MKPKPTSYLPALDGLRAISILLVYLSHVIFYSNISTATIIPGGFGVTIFFFISGFLITRLLLAEIKSDGHINIKMFYIRRLLRLYPPLLAMLFCVTLFLVVFQHVFPYKELFAALFYYENYYNVFFNRQFNYYGILWSLAVEEHFYLFFPLLLLFFIKRLKQLLIVLPLLCIVPLVVRYYIATKYNADSFSFEYTYGLSHCRYDSILYGCISALLIDSGFGAGYIKLTSNKFVYGIGIAAILFSLGFRSEFFRHSFRYTVQGIGLFILIPPIIYSSSYSFLSKMLSSKAMIYIGKLSYSFYLFHFFVIVVMLQYKVPGKALYVVINVVASVAFTLLSYYYVEQPFFRLRKKFGSRIQEETLSAAKQDAVYSA